MADLAYSPKISKKQIGFRFMKEYHNVLYAMFTNALQGIALFCYFDEIYVPLETNGVHMRSSYQKLNVPQMLDKKPYLMLVPHFETI